MILRSFSVTLLYIAVASIGIANADDLRQKYVGQSDCASELKSAQDTYGIRLDKTQDAYLAAYKLKDKNVLTILQRKQANDECKTIRDVVASRHTDDSFIWECTDRRAPPNVIVGTWAAKHPRTTGPALEAWKI